MPNFLSQVKLPNNETYNFHDIEFIEDTRSAAGSTITGSTAASTLYDGKTITISTKYGGQADLQLNLTLSGGTTTGAKYIYTMQGEKLGAQIAAGSVITLMYRSSYSFYKLGASEATTITDAWWMLNTGGTAGQAVAIPFAAVDGTSTSTVFTATVSGITALYDGVCVYLKNGVVTSAANFTININGLGAKPVYGTMAAATRSTTVFNINYTMLFVYNSSRVTGGCWDIFYGYNSNDNTIAYNIRDYQTNHVMNSALYRYMFVFTGRDGKLIPSCGTSNSTSTSKTLTTLAFDPTLPIYYYSTTTTVAANKNPAPGSMWMKYSSCNMRYAFNVSSSALTSKQPVYLRCVDQNNGTLKLDGNNCVVQTLPTAVDNKVYLYLGNSYSAYQVELQDKHPCLIYDSSVSGMVPWNGVKVNVDLSTYAPLASPEFTGSPTFNGTPLATVALSGSYNDLSNKPTIPDVSSFITGNENIQVNLATSTAHPTAPGVTGTLGIANGGTGATTATIAWTNLGGGDSGKHSDTYYIASSTKGVNNGVAELNSSGIVPNTQLPTYVSGVTWDSTNKKIKQTEKNESTPTDVVAFEAGSNITLTGASGKLTIAATDTNTTYTFTGGNGEFKVLPLNGSTQTVSIGKPSTAGTADKAIAANISSTQNAIVKFNDSSGTFSNSSVTIDNNNNISTSGKITIGITPTSSMEVANKGYVDTKAPIVFEFDADNGEQNNNLFTFSNNIGITLSDFHNLFIITPIIIQFTKIDNTIVRFLLTKELTNFKIGLLTFNAYFSTIMQEDTGNSMQSYAFAINDNYIVVGYDVPLLSWNSILDTPDFATVAISGDYNDLINQPTIPDTSNFLTSNEDILVDLESSLANNINPGVTGTLAIGNGGTGATTTAGFWTNFGPVPAAQLPSLYWANTSVTNTVSYNTTPEMATLKLNGNTATISASTKNVTLQYDTSLEVLNFVFN